MVLKKVSLFMVRPVDGLGVGAQDPESWLRD